MTIIGIGTDLCKISRLQRALKRFGNKLAQRLLATDELAQYHQSLHPANLLAKRFAAKEAAAKALGTGIHRLGWRDIFVDHDTRGAPQLRLQGRAHTLAMQKGVTASYLSISDDGDYALAFVVLSNE